MQRIPKGLLFVKLEICHVSSTDRRYSTHQLVTLLKVNTEILLCSTKFSNYLILALLPSNGKFVSNRITLHLHVKNLVCKIMLLKWDEGARHGRPPFSFVSIIPDLNDRFLQNPWKIDTVSNFSDGTMPLHTKERNNKATYLLEVQWDYHRQRLKYIAWN